MKFDTSTVLVDLDGRPVRSGGDLSSIMALLNEMLPHLPEARRIEFSRRFQEAAPALTMRMLVLRAVGSALKGFKPEELGEIFSIAARMPKAGTTDDLDDRELGLLRRAIEQVSDQPLIIGQARAILKGVDPFARHGIVAPQQDASAKT